MDVRRDLLRDRSQRCLFGSSQLIGARIITAGPLSGSITVLWRMIIDQWDAEIHKLIHSTGELLVYLSKFILWTLLIIPHFRYRLILYNEYRRIFPFPYEVTLATIQIRCTSKIVMICILPLKQTTIQVWVEYAKINLRNVNCDTIHQRNSKLTLALSIYPKLTRENHQKNVL